MINLLISGRLTTGLICEGLGMPLSKSFTLMTIHRAGSVAEQVMLLENIGTSVLVSHNQVTYLAFVSRSFIPGSPWIRSLVVIS